MTRILVADDHVVVRAGVRRVLEDLSNYEVVAEAADGKEAIVKAIETKPDVVVLDYALPLMNGSEVTRQIRAQLPRTEVLVFTMHDSEELIEEALKAGARGYLLKSDANRDLIEAVASVAGHRPFFTNKVTDTLLKRYFNGSGQPSSGSILTNRERGVVQLIAEGHSNKQVATVLNISAKTVETHRAAVMRKLNYSSSAALVRYAIRNQLVQA
jgi:DNA-binding NarL/FixJ family response regulator